MAEWGYPIIDTEELVRQQVHLSHLHFISPVGCTRALLRPQFNCTLVNTQHAFSG